MSGIGGNGVDGSEAPRSPAQRHSPAGDPSQPDWFDPNIEHPANRPDPLASAPHGPPDAAARLVTGVEQATHASGPSSWWRLGILLLLVLVVVLFAMQMLTGGVPTTSD